MSEKRLDTLLQKHRKKFYMFVALAALIAVAAMYVIIILRSPALVPLKRTAAGFAALAVLMCAFLILLYIRMSKKNIPTEKLFILFTITTGVVYSLVFMPFSIPDEHVHYLSAYRISNYLTFNFDQAGKEELLLRVSDAELCSLRNNYLSPGYYYSLLDNFKMFSGSAMTSIHSSFINSAPICYIPAAIGIALGRIAHLGAIPTFYLGRFANLAVYALAIWWSMKRIPYGKLAIFTICAMPMTVHLSASYSYDPLIIAAAMLFLSQVLYMREKPGKVTVKDIILCIIWALILAPSKVVYFPILFAIFIIPSDKFNAPKKAVFAIKCCIVAVGAAAILATQLTNISGRMSSGKECVWTDGELYSLSRFLTHPGEALRMFAATIYERTDFNLASMVGSYLGWHQITVPTFVWLPMLAVVGYSFIRRSDEQNGVLSVGSKMWVGLLAIGIGVLVTLSMLFSWTPVGYPYIAGLQGRYYIPILPLLFVVIRGNLLSRPAVSDKYIVYFCFYYNLIMPLVFFGNLFR